MMEVEAEMQKWKSYSGDQISGLIRDPPSEIKQKTVMKIKIKGTIWCKYMTSQGWQWQTGVTKAEA